MSRQALHPNLSHNQQIRAREHRGGDVAVFMESDFLKPPSQLSLLSYFVLLGPESGSYH